MTIYKNISETQYLGVFECNGGSTSGDNGDSSKSKTHQHQNILIAKNVMKSLQIFVLLQADYNMI